MESSSLSHSSQARRFQLKCLIISTAVVGPNHLLLLIIYDAILKWYDEIRRDICVGYPFNFQPFEQTTYVVPQTKPHLYKQLFNCMPSSFFLGFNFDEFYQMPTFWDKNVTTQVFFSVF